MRAFLRRLADALTHTGPGYDLPPHPRRGDQFEQWIKAHRDEHIDGYGRNPAWYALDDLLDNYRLHADMGVPLDGHVCEARAVGACPCLENSEAAR